MEKRKFTYVGGGSSKFWEIARPTLGPNNTWSVKVWFGRIGTWGQSHTNVFHSMYAANAHYQKKINEKIVKGYKETGQVEIKKSVVNYTPDYILPAAKPKACPHDNLTRNGSTWKCKTCGDKVEFEKSAPVEEFEVVAKVRRYFDLSGQ